MSTRSPSADPAQPNWCSTSLRSNRCPNLEVQKRRNPLPEWPASGSTNTGIDAANRVESWISSKVHAFAARRRLVPAVTCCMIASTRSACGRRLQFDKGLEYLTEPPRDSYTRQVMLRCRQGAKASFCRNGGAVGLPCINGIQLLYSSWAYRRFMAKAGGTGKIP
jgi:hypothetical protein